MSEDHQEDLEQWLKEELDDLSHRHGFTCDRHGDIERVQGKPAGGRYNGCSIGGPDQDRAGEWYGGGSVYFDYGCEIGVSEDAEAYFTAPNNVTVLIRGSVAFSDPSKPLFADGRDVTPADLHRGINELGPDHDDPAYH